MVGAVVLHGAHPLGEEGAVHLDRVSVAVHVVLAGVRRAVLGLVGVLERRVVVHGVDGARVARDGQVRQVAEAPHNTGGPTARGTRTLIGVGRGCAYT